MKLLPFNRSLLGRFREGSFVFRNPGYINPGFSRFQIQKETVILCHDLIQAIFISVIFQGRLQGGKTDFVVYGCADGFIHEHNAFIVPPGILVSAQIFIFLSGREGDDRQGLLFQVSLYGSQRKNECIPFQNQPFFFHILSFTGTGREGVHKEDREAQGRKLCQPLKQGMGKALGIGHDQTAQGEIAQYKLLIGCQTGGKAI